MDGRIILNRRLRLVEFVDGVTTSLLGLVVMVGWIVHSVYIIQVSSRYFPMLFNTALGLFICGAGLLSIAAGRNRSGSVFAVLALFLGLLALIQSFVTADFGIDQLFIDDYISVGRTIYPGRMSTNTALCFTLAGFALVFLSVTANHSIRLLAGFFGTAVLTLGAITLGGYLVSNAALYTWGQMSRMAVHASIGFIILGSGITLSALANIRYEKEVKIYWLPASIGLAGIVTTILLWQALVVSERVHIKDMISLEANGIQRSISMALQARVLALDRMADRWAFTGGTPKPEWDYNSQLLMQDYPGYQAIGWLTSSEKLQWVMPQNTPFARDLEPGIHEEVRRAMRQARKTAKVNTTDTLFLTQGGEGIIVCAPVTRDRQGYMVGLIRIRICLDNILHGEYEPGYSMAIFEGNKEIYSRHSALRAHEEDWGQEADIAVYGLTWKIRVWPEPATLEKLQSPLPEVILIAGFLIFPLLALAVDLAQTARSRARAIQESNSILEKEIIERRHAEQAVRESEAKYAALVGQARDGIVIVQDERIKFANEALGKIFGYRSESLIDKSAKDLFTPEYRNQFVEQYKDSLVAGKKQVMGLHEIQALRKDGTAKDVELSGAIIEYGGKSAYLGIIRDVTERKQMETELLKLNKLESIGILAGGIAHDFNNVLTAILGYLSLAKMKVEPESSIYASLGEAEKASLYAKELTHRLLTFSKGGAPIRKVMPIAGLIRESVSWALSGSKSGYKIEIPNDLWLADIDEMQMKQVFNNIVINADEAMPEGGNVTVAAENFTVPDTGVNGLPLPPGKYLRVAIQDQGNGIPEEYLSMIFDPYFSTKERGSQKGMGLGLAIAHSIVTKHGGHIAVDSKIGIGTTFYIYIPAV